MISDPYRILGIRRDATDDEIKKAYRQMSRKYHPDANIGAPNPEQIEEKFKEIQQAYTQIIDERTHGYSSGQEGYSQGHSYAGNEFSVKMQAVANFINSRHFQEALNVLNDIPDHDDQWYFFSSVSHAGLGNNITAKELIAQAVAMNPGNMQYRQFQQQLEYGGNWYSSMGRSYDTPSAGNSYCMKLCLLNLFCNCCCRPF